MTLRWILAALHLLALGVGLGAISVRSSALRQKLDAPGLARVFAADSWWGVAALLWISTGLVRLLSSLEKGVDYYVQNRLFLAKMALFLAVLVLELAPMLALIRWRMTVRRRETPDTTRARWYAQVSAFQAAIVVAMVFVAAAMARGLGMP